jgi:cyclopropane fatty-acyl-phospholipid synthase-like methyltransferase
MGPDELRRRYSGHYLRSQAEVMLSVERRVCGCDYGATSWTTREQAEQLAAFLALRPGVRLLDVGAGAGWPSVYHAQNTGCDITLTDLPLEGLRIAAERACADLPPGACQVAVADGARLPFCDGAFDAVTHNDALCCLPAKREMLEECRRVVGPAGRMAFTVISLGAALTPSQHRRALDCGPQFIEAEADYATLLDESGWNLQERLDLGPAYAETCRAFVDAFDQDAAELTELMGADLYAERRTKLAAVLEGAKEGLHRRELFVAIPR